MSATRSHGKIPPLSLAVPPPLRNDMLAPALALAAALSAVQGPASSTTRVDELAPGVYEIANDRRSLGTFSIPLIGGIRPVVGVAPAAAGFVHVRLAWLLPNSVAQDDVQVAFDLAIRPDLQWLPHLTPVDGCVVSEQVFRAPALLFAEGRTSLALIPDLDLCGRAPGGPWYLDWNARTRRAALGMAATVVPGHGFYLKAPGMRVGPGLVELGFFVRAFDDTATPRNPWRVAADFLWSRWAAADVAHGLPLMAPLEDYVDDAYRFAFERWTEVWRAHTVRGVPVGGFQYLLDVTSSPGWTGLRLPPPTEIWNQAWFSSTRTATGLVRWSRRNGDARLFDRAEQIETLLRITPQQRGLFPCVFRGLPDGGQADLDELPRWTNPDRCPTERGITRDWYHVVDMTTTARSMLCWADELGGSPELAARAVAYGDRLLALQRADGFFPAWLHPSSQAPAPLLVDSPETAASATFLLELAARTGASDRYAPAALRAIDAVLAGPAAVGRWEDFETYWSDSDFGRTFLIGQRVPRNGVFKSNTLSMFWTAEAALAAYHHTGASHYLAHGRRALDELALYQQVWRPPFAQLPTLGGFGVMNADDEWNDARQGLFAELFLDYYLATGEREYFERGVAALRASFFMMLTPRNPETTAQWRAKFPFLGDADIGLTIENYGHAETIGPNGGGIGVISIFDWGAGSGSEAVARIFDRFGQVYVDRTRGDAFGIDGIDATWVNGELQLVDRTTFRTSLHRTVEVVFEDGSRTRVKM